MSGFVDLRELESKRDHIALTRALTSDNSQWKLAKLTDLYQDVSDDSMKVDEDIQLYYRLESQRQSQPVEEDLRETRPSSEPEQPAGVLGKRSHAAAFDQKKSRSIGPVKRKRTTSEQKVRAMIKTHLPTSVVASSN